MEDLHLDQMDVKIAFLHNDLEEELYMGQSQRYVVTYNEDLVCRLKKSIWALTVEDLIYAMICMRPYITYAVGLVSRIMSNLGKLHWEAVKWIIRYLRGSVDKALCFGDAKD
ncbi:hypothetical protein KFK09_009576 [Dendrobium nobile]|uniref:Reverse transcriptase Ty1/copia-type domain-containing protein n=1 Tax=Dendrobium nobile TaxID=94219 RepID=A0A8T3BJX6_DENNO|nr:hypothetical protein KFK09_009576 [Dendrobium nobile]